MWSILFETSLSWKNRVISHHLDAINLSALSKDLGKGLQKIGKNQELECVESAKLLGVTISNNLTWNMHIDQIIKKASKRMYFLIQFKRANVARHELILFYTSCIRSVMTYASPAFFYALPLYLKKDLENVEKRALSITCPGLAYRKALELSNIMSK